MLAILREKAWRLTIGMGAISIGISLPLLWTYLQLMVAMISPRALFAWKQTALGSWILTAAIGGPLVLWELRQYWWPLVARVIQAMAQSVGWALTLMVGLLVRGRLMHVQAAGASEPVRVPGSAPRSGAFYPPLALAGKSRPLGTKPCPEVAQRVQRALTSLGCPETQVVEHFAGPVVSAVRVRLPESLKASTVISLADDMSALLGVRSASMAPVVGAPGILQVDLAGKDGSDISFRTLLESLQFAKSGGLPLLIGADARGRCLVADLCQMPHLLIAGTTGSGKSVLIRQILVSWLYRFSPEDLGLLLVDPKRVELSLFRQIPHLIQGVIGTPEETCQALQELVSTMNSRYRAFEEAGVTDIHSFNAKYPDQRLPYLVAVVDEFADLMASKKHRSDLESVVLSLAQKARAAGIHLVMATQRPSVDVVTGVIKANIPARISLRLASQADSRTVLDGSGAEKLRGKGDLLFRADDQQIRAQAAFVSSDIARSVADWWRDQRSAVPARQEHALGKPVMDRDEEHLRWVKDTALYQGKITRRQIERGLGIASARAQALIGELDQLGWLLPARPPQPRTLSLSADERRSLLADLRSVAVATVVLTEELQSGDG